MRMLFIERLTIANLASIVETSCTPEENSAELATIKNVLDAFSDEEITGLFGDLGEATQVSEVSTHSRHDSKTPG